MKKEVVVGIFGGVIAGIYFLTRPSEPLWQIGTVLWCLPEDAGWFTITDRRKGLFGWWYYVWEGSPPFSAIGWWSEAQMLRPPILCQIRR